MENNILSIRNLSKNYGRIQAVDDLSLDVEEGSVFGILGPNGSGKTTTLGIILDVIRASKGDYLWFGQTPTKKLRQRIGSILEVPIFYPYLSAGKNLSIVADIKGKGHDQIDEVLEITGLLERKNSKFRTYSLGMKQRLAIAAALLGKPDVLILDEPTNGLDPQGIAEIRNLILDVAKGGTTIILASHILDEVQKTCSHVAVLEKGKKLFSGSVDEVINDTQWLEVSASNMKALNLALKNHEFVDSMQEEDAIYQIKLKGNYTAEQLNKSLFEKGITLSHLSSQKKSLEKYFLELLDKS